MLLVSFWLVLFLPQMIPTSATMSHVFLRLPSHPFKISSSLLLIPVLVIATHHLNTHTHIHTQFSYGRWSMEYLSFLVLCWFLLFSYKCPTFILLYSQIKFHCVHVPHFLHWFICWWTGRLVPFPGWSPFFMYHIETPCIYTQTQCRDRTSRNSSRMMLVDVQQIEIYMSAQFRSPSGHWKHSCKNI